MGKEDKKLELDDLEPRASDIDDEKADEITGGFVLRGSSKPEKFAGGTMPGMSGGMGPGLHAPTVPPKPAAGQKPTGGAFGPRATPSRKRR